MRVELIRTPLCCRLCSRVRILQLHRLRKNHANVIPSTVRFLNRTRNLLFPLVFCEKQIPRSARDDNELPFPRKLYKRAWMRSASVLKSLTP